jgi:hypothetical protein
MPSGLELDARYVYFVNYSLSRIPKQGGMTSEHHAAAR